MTLYKGRINSGPNALMDAMNKSLPVDIRFFPYDVKTNRAWANALGKIGVFTPKEVDDVLAALDQIQKRYDDGEFNSIPDDEDIHTLTERLLTEQLGDTGARIHTGRSRNDQVACDLYQYLRATLTTLQETTKALIATLTGIASVHRATIMAGTTHLQPAQPITLGHFLLSLAFALKRDVTRLKDAAARMDRCPLGAGAIAGCGFPVDRHQIARELGFTGPTENSIDTISDRDVVQETAFACAALLTHLSRYAEQFIIWSNPAFGYVRWDAAWSTGSSMMPQKRNPDAMELVRAKAARAIGQTSTLLTLTKGVPLSYAKDLQEDKEAVFDALDTADLTLKVFEQAIGSAQFLPDRMEQVLTGDMLATDLADALVECGVPFRKAHERSARFVTFKEDQGQSIIDATKDEMASHFPEFTNHPFAFNYAASLERRTVFGGTAPARVDEQVSILKKWLELNR